MLRPILRAESTFEELNVSYRWFSWSRSGPVD